MRIEEGQLRRGKHRKRRTVVRKNPSLTVPATRTRAHSGRVLLHSAMISTGIAASLVMGGVAVIWHVLRGLPQVNANTFANDRSGSVVYDVHGKVLGTFARDGIREPIEGINQVSPNLVRAFIAAEDKTFYTNIGIHPAAIVRALYQDITQGHIESGASTITQQTVKLAIFPEQQRTVKRKIQEIALSLEVNHILTKDEIMTDYMNWVYMGKMGTLNVYGVKKASEVLFHQSPDQLTLAQATYLAAIPNNPSYFAPYTHPDRVMVRQRYILDQLATNHLISEAEYQSALVESKHLKRFPAPSSASPYPYLMTQIQRAVCANLVKSGVYSSTEEVERVLPELGLHIYTTVDKRIQDHVDDVLNQEASFRHTSSLIPSENRTDLFQAGMVVMNNRTGGITALAGGRPNHYMEDQIDHSDLARQPGSTVKPLVVYGPAIERRALTAGSILEDSPAVFDEGLPWEYQPKDDSPHWHGKVTLHEALVRSLNLPAVRALYLIHPEVGTSYLPKLGIHPGDCTTSGQPTLVSEDTHHLGVGIGGFTHGLSLKQLTGAFTVFPNEGVWREPLLVTRITDANGSWLYETKPFARRVFSPQTAYIMTQMMSDVVHSTAGTARWGVGAQFPHTFIAGKTGTTDHNENGWFIGFTKAYTMGIWTGYNHNQPISNRMYGIKFQLWDKAMAPLLDGDTTKPSPPSTVIARDVCDVSGQLATQACQINGDNRTEWYIPGTEPTTPCAIHSNTAPLENPFEVHSSPESLEGVGHVMAIPAPGGVTLTWDAAPRASAYTVWRSTHSDGHFTRVRTATPIPLMVDTDVPVGVHRVYYQIRAEMPDGTAVPSGTVEVDVSPTDEGTEARPQKEFPKRPDPLKD